MTKPVSQKIQTENRIKNTLKVYVQLQVTGNTHSLPDRRKVILLSGKQWIKNGIAQRTKEANGHVGEKQKYNPGKGGIRGHSQPENSEILTLWTQEVKQKKFKLLDL